MTEDSLRGESDGRSVDTICQINKVKVHDENEVLSKSLNHPTRLLFTHSLTKRIHYHNPTLSLRRERTRQCAVVLRVVGLVPADQFQRRLITFLSVTPSLLFPCT